MGDLSDHRQVTKTEGEEKANKMGVMFMETSAKSGDNIKALFRKVATDLPGMDDQHKNENNDNTTNVQLNDMEQTNIGTGCIVIVPVGVIVILFNAINSVITPLARIRH